PIVPKHRYSSPVTRPSTLKEWPYSISITSSPIMESPRRLSRTVTSDSYQSFHQNCAAFSISNRTSARHITLKLMEQAKEQIKPWNNISEYSAELNRTTGTLGSPLHNTPRIPGPLRRL